jgi:hypothetical protein
MLQVELKSGKIPFDAREVKTLFAGLVLLEMEDVAAVTKNKISDRRVKPAAVRALHQKNRSILQDRPPDPREQSTQL